MIRVSPGSSPLARGLRVGVHGLVGQPRIIPARAGFTPAPASTPGSSTDHPRSRGVYQVLENVEQSVQRIIPARAGFTPRTAKPLCGTPDHPRSRGVYIRGRDTDTPTQGSSPLARGLQSHRYTPWTHKGIIPARAGFTKSFDPFFGLPADHPRSRGVYMPGCCRYRTGTGSSPLARGLLLGDHPLPLLGGIIPARAGFTVAVRAEQAVVEDHPRSRGVYTHFAVLSCLTDGSSPLARGLLVLGAFNVLKAGIIPARAGFTCAVVCGGCAGRDHPRSRGVYQHRLDEGGDEEGSSPLARGLRCLLWLAWFWGRIIPARAGFTLRTAGGGRCTRDHPRSRGVYDTSVRPHGVHLGSSPLARGLRPAIKAWYKERRIIPARAGFTYGKPPSPTGKRDHPRSRGVYTCQTRPTCPGSGSSPLARGLPAGLRQAPHGAGIIPARAGFTRTA